MPRSVLAALAAAACASSLALVPAAAGAHASRPSHTHPLPTQVDAPYLDVTSVPSLSQTAAQSGSHYLTLAFLQTEAPGSCDLAWAGNPATTVAGGAYADEVAAIQRAGGDVIPSFGGYTADTTDTEIAASCTDVDAIAAAYEQVLTTYHVQRLDFDIEADTIADTAANDRRNEAIAQVEAWAKRTHHKAEFSYTLPSTPNGLGATGVAVLASAAAHGARIHDVNLMTFDYWDGAQHDMVADAESAAAGLTAQLKQTLYPRLDTEQLYRRVGIIEMNGIDDFGPTETFTVSDAKKFEAWAAHRHLAYIGFWALNRDNGACPGTKGAWNCSGVAQGDWDFSHAFAPFTTGR